MYIRSSIAVLKELDGLVPLFEDQAISWEASVTELLKRKKREDVRVLACGSVLFFSLLFHIRSQTHDCLYRYQSMFLGRMLVQSAGQQCCHAFGVRGE
jgi:hypothetical protein